MSKIAFDLHGVLDTIFIHEILEKISKSHEIFILSGSPSIEIKETLFNINYLQDVHYHKVLSIVDYVKDEIKIPCYQKESTRTGKLNWYCDENIWWTMKSVLCNKNRINVLFDDKTQYMRYFRLNEHPTKFNLVHNHTVFIDMLKEFL